MNGVELARKAQALRPKLRVLFTSGYTEDTIVHDGQVRPGALLLSKPYRTQELAVKVRQALDDPIPEAVAG
jgi:DNA-binding NarL/FixJ family response regulator